MYDASFTFIYNIANVRFTTTYKVICSNFIIINIHGGFFFFFYTEMANNVCTTGRVRMSNAFL